VLCNCPPQWFSDVGHLLLAREDAPEIAVLYCDSERSGRRTYSLRSRTDGPDVSHIAAHHHGGGHPRAAGFRAELGELPLGLLPAYDHPAQSRRPAAPEPHTCCGRCAEEQPITIPAGVFGLPAAPVGQKHPLQVCE
jgi:hypothetical protein